MFAAFYIKYHNYGFCDKKKNKTGNNSAVEFPISI